MAIHVSLALCQLLSFKLGHLLTASLIPGHLEQGLVNAGEEPAVGTVEGLERRRLEDSKRRVIEPQ